MGAEKLYSTMLTPVKELATKPTKRMIPVTVRNPLVDGDPDSSKKGKRIVCSVSGVRNVLFPDAM